jgi:hypothetical protein
VPWCRQIGAFTASPRSVPAALTDFCARDARFTVVETPQNGFYSPRRDQPIAGLTDPGCYPIRLGHRGSPQIAPPRLWPAGAKFGLSREGDRGSSFQVTTPCCYRKAYARCRGGDVVINFGARAPSRGSGSSACCPAIHRNRIILVVLNVSVSDPGDVLV